MQNRVDHGPSFTAEFPSFLDYRGRLTVLDHKDFDIPFEIKRLYWINGTCNEVSRGGHAHLETVQLFFCVNGRSFWSMESEAGVDFVELESPDVGLFIPKMVWHEFKLEPGAVILAVASTYYDESDYIRDYAQWKKMLP